jgi:hypothetical protein
MLVSQKEVGIKLVGLDDWLILIEAFRRNWVILFEFEYCNIRVDWPKDVSDSK